MNKTLKTTCGLALIAVGVIWALLTLDIIEFSFSTQGWWALFIIIPCFYNLLTGKDKGGAVVGVCIGVAPARRTRHHQLGQILAAWAGGISHRHRCEPSFL